jgi:hypothetical protein
MGPRGSGADTPSSARLHTPTRPKGLAARGSWQWAVSPPAPGPGRLHQRSDGTRRAGFTALAPDQCWGYCAAGPDLGSRRRNGWSIADRLPAELVVEALEMPAGGPDRSAPSSIPIASPCTQAGGSGTGPAIAAARLYAEVAGAAMSHGPQQGRAQGAGEAGADLQQGRPGCLRH